MNPSDEQIEELARIYPGVKQAVEAGVTYFYLPQIELGEGCIPSAVDALLCPTPRDGYESRLFLAQSVSTKTVPNWNASNVRILERNWFAVSWRTRAGLRMAQMVSAHLEAFR